jgi:hypothetical protein
MDGVLTGSVVSEAHCDGELDAALVVPSSCDGEAANAWWSSRHKLSCLSLKGSDAVVLSTPCDGTSSQPPLPLQLGERLLLLTRPAGELIDPNTAVVVGRLVWKVRGTLITAVCAGPAPLEVFVGVNGSVFRIQLAWHTSGEYCELLWSEESEERERARERREYCERPESIVSKRGQPVTTLLFRGNILCVGRHDGKVELMRAQAPGGAFTLLSTYDGDLIDKSGPVHQVRLGGWV